MDRGVLRPVANLTSVGGDSQESTPEQTLPAPVPMSSHPSQRWGLANPNQEEILLGFTININWDITIFACCTMLLCQHFAMVRSHLGGCHSIRGGLAINLGLVG